MPDSEPTPRHPAMSFRSARLIRHRSRFLLGAQVFEEHVAVREVSLRQAIDAAGHDPAGRAHPAIRPMTAPVPCADPAIVAVEAEGQMAEVAMAEVSEAVSGPVAGEMMTTGVMAAMMTAAAMAVSRSGGGHDSGDCNGSSCCERQRDCTFQHGSLLQVWIFHLRPLVGERASHVRDVSGLSIVS